MSQKNVNDDHREISRTCSILESIAQQFDPASPEHQAIDDAAAAYVLVHQRKSLRSAYQQLKSAVGDDIDQEIIDKLKSMGIDPDELDSDELT